MNRELKEKLTRSPKGRILVIGDSMLDRVITTIESSRKCAEVHGFGILELIEEKLGLGGASNVVRLLRGASAEAVIDFVTCVGKDSEGDIVKRKLGELGVTCYYGTGNCTTLKTRIHGEFEGMGWRQVCRIDRDASGVNGLMVPTEDKYELCVVSDYGKGVVEFLPRIREVVKCPVVAAVRPGNAGYVRNVWSVVVNEPECRGITGGAGLHTLKETVNCEVAVVTRGKDGYEYLQDGVIGKKCSKARVVNDVTGCGDAFLAYFAFAHFQGLDVGEALEVGNAAAGLVAGQIGTGSVSMSDVIGALVDGS